MVASKEVLQEAQEIKRRLLSKGEYAEETVICELLESLDSDFKGNKIQHIINMITDNQNFDDQTYEDQAGPSHVDTTYSFDTPNSMDYKTCEDLTHLSSESEDDRDFYYFNNSDTVDIIDEEVSNSSSPPTSPLLPISSSSPSVFPLDLPVSSQEEATNNNKAEIANNNTSSEMEMEENNNDVICETKREAESPKPGCSKDLMDDMSSKSDDFCDTCNLEDLQKDAKQIHNILPSYDYSLIYETLLKNQNVINRIEITLWDLLPKKRPVAKILCFKEKPLDKVDSDNSDETKVAADTMSVPFAEEATRINDINNVNPEITKLKEKVNNLNNISKRVLQDQGPDSTKPTQKKFRCNINDPGILRPAKLTFDNPIPMPAPLDKQQQFLPASLPSQDISLSQRLSPSHLSCLLPREVHTLMFPWDTKISKSKQVLSPPKLHLPKQPDHVTSTSPNTSKASLIELNNIFLSQYRRNVLNVPFEIKQSAAGTASNKTLCETREAIWKPYSVENAHLPDKRELSEKILNLRTIPRSLKLSQKPSNRTKDMPILNASHSFNGNNEAHQEKSDDDVHQIPNTKDKEIVRYEQTNQVKKKNAASTSAPKEVVLSQKSSKIYYKLIPMFPTVHTEYIKRLCENYVEDDSQFNEAEILQRLAEHLLERGKEYPSVKKVEPVATANTYDLNEQYADLLGIFPEADPGYLRGKAEQIYTDPEKIKEFVQAQLENPDYPTRQQSLAKKKITDQVKQYTTDFQIERFLEIFPDPFSYFEDDKRQCKFNPHGGDFLKNHFSKIRVNTLFNIYTQNKHNLSLTAKALENLNPDMKTKRYSNSRHVLTQDIPLLQECAFIQHKEELRLYLAQLKEKEEKEFNELKKKNELLECQCCFDTECMPSKCSTCEDGHIFCNTCIIRSTDVILADGKTHVHCLMNCGSEFPLAVLQRVLQPTKFSILLCKRQEAEVMAAGLEGLVSCPFCHFASIPPLEDKVFKCLNPNCMKESCRFCKELSHIPLKCNEVKNTDAARLYLEEKMTEALVRKCWKCGRTFFKEEGCNKMSCMCGAQMCYICDKPVTDYKHFQGQGGEGNLCPLWSDDRRLNAESVIKVCNETLKHIKEKNPQVDINVAALLPKLPPKRRGPHEEIARADIVPEHANRIVRQIP